TYGVDLMKDLQLALPSPDNEAILTPTEIAQRIGEKSAQSVNSRLCEIGLQVRPFGKWELTEAGKEYGVLLDVNKLHSDGTPIQQIKWKESVVASLAPMFALVS